MLNKQGPGKIDYCQYTWNPLTGCTHGCEYCYLQRLQKRFNRDFMMPQVHRERFADISKSRKLKRRDRIFVCDAGDLFGEWVNKNTIHEIINIIRMSPIFDFLLLTKNPKRYYEFEFPENAWLGTTVDRDDFRNDFRRSVVADTVHSGVKFISFEPLLSGIPDYYLDGSIDWIILGGNSNAGIKKPPDEWADALIKRARELSIAVWIKDNYKYKTKIKELPGGYK